MLDGLKGLFGSKKFWLSTIIAPVVLGVVASVLPIMGIDVAMTETIITWLGGIMGAGVGGIGLADFGKEASKIKG